MTESVVSMNILALVVFGATVLGAVLLLVALRPQNRTLVLALHSLAEGNVTAWKEYRREHSAPPGPIVDVDFEESILSEADFGQMHLVRPRFGGAQMVECSFRSSRLERPDFRDAVLQEVDFSDAEIYDPVFAGTVMAREALMRAKALYRGRRVVTVTDLLGSVTEHEALSQPRSTWQLIASGQVDPSALSDRDAIEAVVMRALEADGWQVGRLSIAGSDVSYFIVANRTKDDKTERAVVIWKRYHRGHGVGIKAVERNVRYVQRSLSGINSIIIVSTTAFKRGVWEVAARTGFSNIHLLDADWLRKRLGEAAASHQE
jgi:hypothetical protein